jgi:hypothetical protein
VIYLLIQLLLLKIHSLYEARQVAQVTCRLDSVVEPIFNADVSFAGWNIILWIHQDSHRACIPYGERHDGCSLCGVDFNVLAGFNDSKAGLARRVKTRLPRISNAVTTSVSQRISTTKLCTTK